MSKSELKYFAGLDVGGSTIKVILIDEQGNTVGNIVEVKSHVKEGYQTTFEQLRAALNQLVAETGINLDDIKGIGPATRNKLLKHFGSVDNVKKANPEALAQVVGKKLAETILKQLSNQI